MGIKHTLERCWRAARIWSVGSWRWGWARTNQCTHAILENWKRGWDWEGAAAVRSRGTPCALWFCTGQVKAAAAVKGMLCSWWGGKVSFSKTMLEVTSSPSINITRWSLSYFWLNGFASTVICSLTKMFTPLQHMLESVSKSLDLPKLTCNVEISTLVSASDWACGTCGYNAPPGEGQSNASWWEISTVSILEKPVYMSSCAVNYFPVLLTEEKPCSGVSIF